MYVCAYVCTYVRTCVCACLCVRVCVPTTVCMHAYSYSVIMMFLFYVPILNVDHVVTRKQLFTCKLASDAG